MNAFQKIKQEISQTGARLVAVSKNRSIHEIMELYNQGQRIFAENKVQHLLDKHTQLPEDIEWHLIGHLQSNKVKYLMPFVQLIHSVDSLKLLLEINKEAARVERVIKVLIQIHIAQEENKFGADEKELIEILEYYTAPESPLKNIEICGLMGMATFTDDEKLIESEFKKLNSLFHFAKDTYLLNKSSFCEISMGMSNDYKIAIENGSTLIRIGSLLFENNHKK